MTQVPNSLHGRVSVADVQRALCTTLSPDMTQRHQAETYLSACSPTEGFPLLLLQLVREHSNSERDGLSAAIRSTAAVYFKNLISKGWSSTDAKSEICLVKDDRNAIKAHIVKLVCSCVSFVDVKQQLSQALTIIAAADFPANWPELMPEIVQNFGSRDKKTISGMLLTANSILKRFRYAHKSDALYGELEYVLGVLAAPLTKLFLRLGQELEEAEDKTCCIEVQESLRLTCRIFFSLNWQDLPEFFEDNIAEWMDRFEFYLRYNNKIMQVEGGGAIERLQVSIVENISLYAHKYEEEFSPFLPRFVSAIWQRLVKLGLLPEHDHLAAKSIRFLAEVAGKQMNTSIFAQDAAIRQVIESIVIPNMLLRDSDIELFEDSPLEYIARDFENADAETRRRSACDLIAALCKHHDVETTRICLEYIMSMLQKYAESPLDQWRGKDAALHLVIALSICGESSKRGNRQSPVQLNIMSIYFPHIACELSPHHGCQPIILADAIQIVCIFRNEIPSEELLRVLSLLGHHLSNTKIVIQSYAAACMERIITPPTKVAKHQLKPLLGTLFEALFSIPQSGHQESHETTASAPWENEYVMKAVMRLLVVSQTDILPVARIITDKLCVSLGRACINPRNPKYNHYLFESLAILVRVACGADNGGASTDYFEQMLFPPFQSILQMDVVEFAPYVFQILALLLGYKRSLSRAYASLLPPLLHPALWERRGNVPALAGLLEVYLSTGADHIVLSNQLEPILGVFQKLLASKASEAHAFDLLKSVVLQIDSTGIDNYIATVLKLLLARLVQNRDRNEFCHQVFVFLCLLAGKRGGVSLANSVESQQHGLLADLLLHVFALPLSETNVANISDVKIAAIGSTRILCEAPDALVRQGDTKPWKALAEILSKFLNQLNSNSVVVDRSVLQHVPEDGAIGFDATYSKLCFGSRKCEDAFCDIHDVEPFVLSHFKQLGEQRPNYKELISTFGWSPGHT